LADEIEAAKKDFARIAGKLEELKFEE